MFWEVKMFDSSSQALRSIFHARSVALVGASTDPQKFGYQTLDTLLKAGYDGMVYPINPNAENILGLKAYPTLSATPDEVELAIIIVPAQFVAGVLREAAAKGAKGALVLSAGFRESGFPEREAEIAAVAQETGLRFLGPNIQGINYTPNRLCAMFFPVITARGPLAFISQSGSVTAAFSQWAQDDGLGISAAVNLGNAVDMGEAEALEYFARDEHTTAIALYLEGIKDGARFIEAVKRVAPQKPIAILKTGRSESGKKSVQSHTGALAGNDAVFDGFCRQFGVVRAHDLDDLYDKAKALATLPPPSGRRVLVVSSSGGGNTLAVDEIERGGLDLPSLPAEYVAALKNAVTLGQNASAKNPLDLAAAGMIAENYERAVLLADGFNFADTYLILLGDPIADTPAVMQRIRARLRGGMAVSYFGGGELEKEARRELHTLGIPVYSTPEKAARALGAAVWSAEKRRALGEMRLETQALPAKKSNAVKFLPEPQAVQLIETYGVDYPAHRLAHSTDEATRLAGQIGYPVALKVVSPQIVHKSEVGGVAVNLASAEAVCRAWEEMMTRIHRDSAGAQVEGVLVCRQAAPGLELIVGALKDPTFGAAVMLGMGGVFTEVWQDASFRLAPIEERDALEMARELKGYPLLAGTRGLAPLDLAALTRLLLNISRLMMEHPEVEQLDLNPVRMYLEGCLALDARILLNEAS